MKRRYFLGAAIATLFTRRTVRAQPAPLSPSDRSRALMSLIRGPVSLGNNQIDNLVAETTPIQFDRWGSRFYNVYGPLVSQDGENIPWADLNPNQKGRFFLNSIRRHFGEINRATSPGTAAEAARRAEIQARNTETEVDLGAN